MTSFLRPSPSLLLAAVAAAGGLVACSADTADSAYYGGAAPGAPASRASAPEDPSPAAEENEWTDTSAETTSTFAIDVDTGSYTMMRREALAGRTPAPETVRPEEFLNYFRYAYPQPSSEHPFSVSVDAAPSLFGDDPTGSDTPVHLVRIGLQGRTIPVDQRAHANLVFLVDVSGSMQSADKLPLVQYSLKQLVRRLDAVDTLGIVTYAGSERVALPPTPVTAANKGMILEAIDALAAGGSTNGEGGIRKAYEVAEQVATDGAINRVILCTDGDFNVGLTGDALVGLIETERDKGVTLTTLGFGTGNYNDEVMEGLADHGNGNYGYVDSAGEANRVLGEKLVSTLQVIAKDVKIQVEFDPASVLRYRLVGYENRVMANEDFRNDAKDAGELGAGHSVTALYEVMLAPGGTTESVGTVRLRYKQPDATETMPATELAQTIARSAIAASFDAASPDLRFAAATAEYAEILRRSKHSVGARFDDVGAIVTATASGQADRTELATLVQKAKAAFH